LETTGTTAEVGPPAGVSWPLASRRRRFASLSYEAFLLTAVLFVASFILVPITQILPPGSRRTVLQAALCGVAGTYCVYCWRKGQTLAMKAWGIVVRRADGGALDTRGAGLRYLWALLGLFAAGAGFLWSFVDRDSQFLHDRLAGTRLFDVDRSAPLEARDHEHAGSQEQ